MFNIRSSVKVAEDFVSPEHIGRCLELTEDFRRLPPKHRRGDDLLGVKDIMVHAVSHALSVLDRSQDGEVPEPVLFHRDLESSEDDA